MGRYCARRLLETIPLMLVISIFVFMFIHLLPGDPAQTLAGKEATVEEVEAIRAEFGLDKPLIVQYFNYMKDLFRGDMGRSLKSNIPVSELIWSRFQFTIQLVCAGLVWAPFAGIFIGVICAIKRGTFLDLIGMLLAICGLSAPGFWLGLMGIQYFSVHLGWFPVSGLDSWRSFILPSIVMGTGIMATLARYSRSSMLEIIRQDYMRTARAKGVSKMTVILHHGMRNCWIPIITVAGLQFGTLLGGIVIIENVFAWPGVGNFLLTSITSKDTPCVLGAIVLFTVVFSVVNLVVDIIYAFVDPRIKAQYK